MAGDDKPAEGGNVPAVMNDREGAAGRSSRQRNNRRANRTAANGVPNQSTFEGRIEALKGFTYDCSETSRQAEMFTKTTREIAGYVGREFRTGGDDVCRAVDMLELPTFTKPPRPDSDTADEYDRIEWVGEMKAYQLRMTALEENMRRLYNVVYGQCSDIMISKLMAVEDFETDVIDTSDALGLLRAIKQIAFNFESQKFEPHAIHDAIKQFYTFRQGPHMTPQVYLEEFNNNVDVLTYCGGTVGTSIGLRRGLA